LILCGAGAKIRLSVYRCVLGAADAGILDHEGRRKASEVLEVADPGPADLPALLRCEWASVLGSVQALYPKERLNRKLAQMIGYLEANGRARYVDVDRIRLSRVAPAELVAAADEYFASLLNLANQPVSSAVLRQVELVELKARTGRVGEHPLGPLVLPTMGPVFREELRCVVFSRGARLIFGLLNYRERHGAWPTSLSQACNDPILRTDPCSGEDFIYRLTSTDRAGKHEIALYSVGEDGIDEGGRHGPWGTPSGQMGAGRDFVISPYMQGE
jgi:hypothetical protein